MTRSTPCCRPKLGSTEVDCSCDPSVSGPPCESCRLTFSKRSRQTGQVPEIGRFLSKFKRTEGCWLWCGTMFANGYGEFNVRDSKKKGGRRKLLAHRVSWTVFRGEIPPEKCVIHKCDVSACVNPDHLYLGTAKDNARDRNQRGRDKRDSRLSYEKADQIRKARVSGEAIGSLAKRYEVSYVTIQDILAARRWVRPGTVVKAIRVNRLA